MDFGEKIRNTPAAVHLAYGAVIVLLLLIMVIIGLAMRQPKKEAMGSSNTGVYTSGATDRMYSEFTSTDQAIKDKYKV